MLLTDRIDPAVWTEPTPEEVVDFSPHCRLSRCRLIFTNIYRPFSKLGSSGAPATSATCDNTARLTSLDVVEGKADFESLAIEEQVTPGLQLTLDYLPVDVEAVRPRG
ncbi:hypothetical protein ACHAO7_010157 [Fusarium culmorum]